MFHDLCKRGMMETKPATPQDEMFKEPTVNVDEANLDSVESMIKEAHIRMENIGRGRELVDQKITYFLGVVLLTFSSTFVFGLKPMMHLFVEKMYLPFVVLLLCFSGMAGLICYLVAALLPRPVYIGGTEPFFFWANGLLTLEKKKSLIELSKYYERKNNKLVVFLEWKSKKLKTGVMSFAVLLVVFTLFCFFLPDFPRKLLDYMKA